MAPIDDVAVLDDGTFYVVVEDVDEGVLRSKEFQEACWRIFKPREN